MNIIIARNGSKYRLDVHLVIVDEVAPFLGRANRNNIVREDSVMPINKNEITKETIAKAMQCETADELIALADSEGIELTKEEAEAYLAELEDFELDSDVLRNVAGGGIYETVGTIIKEVPNVVKNINN